MTTRGLLSFGLGLLLCACPGDDSDDAAGTETDTESTTGSTGAPATTVSMTTMMAEEGTTTGQPQTDSTGEDTTAGPADSSGSSDGSGGSSSDGSGGSSSSGGDGNAVYMACDLAADPECPDPWGNCYAFIRGYTVCTLPCAQANECPPPPDGDAVPVCGGQGQDQCLLDCQNDETCPTGMECQTFMPGGGPSFSRCVWPN